MDRTEIFVMWVGMMLMLGLIAIWVGNILDVLSI